MTDDTLALLDGMFLRDDSAASQSPRRLTLLKRLSQCTTDLRHRAIDDIHVHLIAFIAHQFYRLQDNLVDVLLASVKTFENTALREHRDWCFDQRKQHERAAAGLLDDLDASVLQILRSIRELVVNDVLTDTEKVAKIGALVPSNPAA